MSNNTPEFKASQRKHSDEIKARRVLEKTLGISSEQARQRLRAFDQQVRNEQNRPAIRQAEVEVRAEPKGMEVVAEQKVELKPLPDAIVQQAINQAVADGNNGNNGGGGAAVVGAVFLAAINNNGLIEELNVLYQS